MITAEQLTAIRNALVDQKMIDEIHAGEPRQLAMSIQENAAAWLTALVATLDAIAVEVGPTGPINDRRALVNVEYLATGGAPP